VTAEVQVQVSVVVVEKADRRQSIRDRIHRLHDRVRAHVHRRHEAHVAHIRRGVTSRLSVGAGVEVVVNLSDELSSAVHLEVIAEGRVPEQAWLISPNAEPVQLAFASPGEIIIEDLEAAEDVEVQVLMADGDAVVIWLEELVR